MRALTILPPTTKAALTVEQGGLPSRIAANSIGHVGNLLTGAPIVSMRSFVNPSGERAEKHEESAELLESAEPHALKDTKLRLGGGDIVDDILWKRENADTGPLKWNQRIGGRVWHNPRTGILGKLLGTVGTPLASTLTPLLRAPHYSPYTDVATNFWDERGVTEHELGHAIDFNTVSSEKGKGKLSPTALGRQGRGLARDAYGIAYNLPLVKLWHEAMANRRSSKALDKSLGKNSDERLRHQADRDKVLPAAYGSYVGRELAPVVGGVGPLAGMLVGKGVGMGLKSETDAKLQQREETKKEPKKKDKEKDMADRKELSRKAATAAAVELLQDAGFKLAGSIFGGMNEQPEQPTQIPTPTPAPAKPKTPMTQPAAKMPKPVASPPPPMGLAGAKLASLRVSHAKLAAVQNILARRKLAIGGALEVCKAALAMPNLGGVQPYVDRASAATGISQGGLVGGAAGALGGAALGGLATALGGGKKKNYLQNMLLGGLAGAGAGGVAGHMGLTPAAKPQAPAAPATPSDPATVQIGSGAADGVATTLDTGLGRILGGGAGAIGGAANSINGAIAKSPNPSAAIPTPPSAGGPANVGKVPFPDKSKQDAFVQEHQQQLAMEAARKIVEGVTPYKGTTQDFVAQLGGKGGPQHRLSSPIERPLSPAEQLKKKQEALTASFKPKPGIGAKIRNTGQQAFNKVTDTVAGGINKAREGVESVGEVGKELIQSGKDTFDGVTDEVAGGIDKVREGVEGADGEAKKFVDELTGK
jgi:hypothetical protein